MFCRNFAMSHKYLFYFARGKMKITSSRILFQNSLDKMHYLLKDLVPSLLYAIIIPHVCIFQWFPRTVVEIERTLARTDVEVG